MRTFNFVIKFISHHFCAYKNLSHSQVFKQQQQNNNTKIMIPYVLLMLSFFKNIWLVDPFVFGNNVALFFCRWLATFPLPFYWTTPVSPLILTLYLSYTKFSKYIWNWTLSYFIVLFVYNVLVPNYLMWKYIYTAIELQLTYYFSELFWLFPCVRFVMRTLESVFLI